MLTQDTFKNLLIHLQFTEEKNQVFTKNFPQNAFLKVDFTKKELIYPEIFGLIINERQTCNFSANENFVVFECVHRLLEKGYKPQHIELEPKWKLGRGASGGRADILVKDQENNPLLLIECKTAGKEFEKAWKETQQDGGQLFSYAQQIQETQFLCLYASDFEAKTNTLTISQRIISHKDNKDVLEEDKNLKSFVKAQNVKERYEIWKNTYKLENTESGIFEENIQAYQIGKDKYTLEFDTKPLSSIDKKGLYHEFRTILRTYNVSRRENAFDVLVNLFMCKIIDEKENKNDLKFFWKGIAYDNYYDLVDRLQGLYQEGMKRFLEEDILYVSNEQIDKAFWTTKGNRNATKTRIKEIFRELKFFKGLDFEFIKVHNKKGFDKNAKILIKIIQMWQHIRITTQNQNQFLGDMFEYFLDNGIKQTEGQFFTPIPICKFIVASLPLEQKIKDKSEPLKVIDYACGAGHFLNEYALAIKPLVEKHKQTNLNDYHKQIFGIEKEDRLAKVAKVSAYMYGQDEIQIIDDDALASNPKIKEQTFDVLIANPPFAVSDFLITLNELDEKESTKFELFSEESRNTNNIQCFFLERAKHLLAPDAVTGVIVPTSILSNTDAMHMQTREILLKYFDFISLVELGSGTFGKTGTNTVVLFLKRKTQNPEQAEHFWNRTQDYFENPNEEIESNGGVYQDLQVLKKYCEHIEIPFEDYKTFLMTTSTFGGFRTLQTLEKYEIFKDYKQDFDKSTDIINLQKATVFRKKTETEQQTELHQRFIKYLHKIEMQKLYFFMLAYHNPQKVLIVKSPQDNKEQKQFLGYEWSTSKGNEGIKYNGGETVYDIETPLFNPNNRDDQSKISYLIQQNFQFSESAKFSESLGENANLCTYTPLVDMLDFTRKDFNKAISLNAKNMKPIDTKWEYIKIEKAFLEIKNGKSVTQFDEIGNYKVSRIETIATASFDPNAVKYTNDNVKEEDFLQKGDILFSHINSVQHLAKTAVFNLDEKIVHGINLLKFRPNPAILIPAYAYEIFKHPNFIREIQTQAQKAINQASVNTAYLKELKIPLPPLDIQEKIVAECEAIDQTTTQAQTEVEKAKKEIEESVSEVLNTTSNEIRIGQLSETSSGGTPLSSKNEYYHNGQIAWINSGEVGQGEIWKAQNFITELGLKNSSAKIFPKETILLAMYGATAGKVGVLKIEACTNQAVCGILPNEKYLPKFLYLQLYTMYDYLLSLRTGIARDNLSQSKIQDIKIKLPPLSIQEALVKEIEILEQKISENENIIKNAPQAKSEVMRRYL